MKNSGPDNFGAHVNFVGAELENVTPRHYWCNRTPTVVDVDDQPVHKTACNSVRPCFEE